MAKLYKITGYVTELNGFPENKEELVNSLKNGTNDLCITIGNIQEVDIGEWSDNHELNKIDCDREKYFK